MKDLPIYRGLNPCYSGICSVSFLKAFPNWKRLKGLNPCYSGICSVSARRFYLKVFPDWVLILVIVEYAL